MMQQPSLFSREVPVPSKPPEANSDSNHSQRSSDQRKPAARQVPRWLQLLELSVRVIVRIYLGLIVVALPWTHFWSDNHLLLFVPHLSTLALNGVTRGVVSGLGLLNIWIGLRDLWTALYNAIRHKSKQT